MLVGFAFGALGMAISTFMRSWQDFDLMGSAQFTLFLFSGTFVPAQAYPTVLHWLVEITPLYRSVHLIRGVALGGGGWALAARRALPAGDGGGRPAGGLSPDGRLLYK